MPDEVPCVAERQGPPSSRGIGCSHDDLGMARWIGQREQTVGDGAKIVPADHGIGRCDVRLQPVEQIEDGVPSPRQRASVEKR